MRYRVYWGSVGAVDCRDFEDMSKALKYTEELRGIKRDGGAISHIVMSCEHPDQVGEMGVGVTDETYDWTKRRIVGTGRKVV